MVTPVNQARRREIDEKHLVWLRLRAEGWSLKSIAVRFGVTAAGVAYATSPIKAADIAESGEADAHQAYWRDK